MGEGLKPPPDAGHREVLRIPKLTRGGLCLERAHNKPHQRHYWFVGSTTTHCPGVAGWEKL